MAKVENSPTFLPEYPLTRLVPGSRAVYKFDKKRIRFLTLGRPKDAKEQNEPDSHEVAIGRILGEHNDERQREDNGERPLTNLIRVPWDFLHQSPTHHNQADLDETPLDALAAYFINKKRSSTESQVAYI